MTFQIENLNPNNFAAYEAGLAIPDCDENNAFTFYREAVRRNEFAPGIAASVCFVAGYLGNDFPEHDDRIYA